MFKYLLTAIFLVIIFALIYWFYHSDSARRRNSEARLQESAGIFDENARAALRELDRIERPIARDYFRRGHIIRYNILEGTLNPEYIGGVVNNYTHALLDMQADDANDFMIYQIENLNNDLVMIEDPDEYIAQLIAGFNNAVTTNAPRARAAVISERRDQASLADTRAEAVSTYFDLASTYTSDTQNVHDSKVNSDLRDTLIKIKSDRIDPARAVEEAREYIHTEVSRTNNGKAASAQRTLDKIKEGGFIGTFNDTEDRIFAYTWDRCKHPRNHENADLMRGAIVTALADSIENDNIVCINGRCSRLLGSLVLLDYDKDVGSAMTFEAYRNQIFQETKAIINDAIARAQSSPDPDMRAVGDAYETGDDFASEAAETEFKLSIKTDIDRNIDNYASKLSAAEINNIKQECYVYATL